MPRGESRGPSQKDIESQFDVFPRTSAADDKDITRYKPKPDKKLDFSNWKRAFLVLGAWAGLGAEAKVLSSIQHDSPEEIAAKLAEAQDLMADQIAAKEVRRHLISEAEEQEILIAPDWSTDPETLQDEAKLLLTTPEHAVDEDIANKIDIGALAIAKIEAEKIINHQEALKLKGEINVKREHFLELAKDEPLSQVMHEIIQEHAHYNPAIVDLKSFIETGTGNCRAAALGFLVYSEKLKTIYPGIEFKFQSFGGKIPHVRLIMQVEGQWFAVEKPTLTPITLEPGTALEDVTALALQIAEPEAKIKSTLVPGKVEEGPEVSAETETRFAALQDETPDPFMNSLGNALTAKPTATYGNGEFPEAQDMPPVSYAEAQKQIQEVNPVAQLIQAEVDKKIAVAVKNRKEKKIYNQLSSTVYEILFSLPVYKDLDDESKEKMYTAIEQLEAAGKLDQLQADFKARTEWLYEPPSADSVSSAEEYPKMNLAEKFAEILNEYNQADDTEYPGIVLTGEKRKALIDDKYGELTTNKVISFNDLKSDHEGIKLTTEDLNKLSKAAQDGWFIQTSANTDPEAVHALINVNLTYTVLPTINQPWFEKLPIGDPGQLNLTFRSHDKNLDALKRFKNNELVDRLDVDAPLEDFSGINHLLVNSPIFRNISPNARLETLNYQVKNSAAAAPRFFNPPPEISFSALQPKFSNNFDIELDAAGTSIIDRRDVSQLNNCRNLELDADFTVIDLSNLHNSKNLQILVFKNPNLPLQNFEFLKNIPDLTSVNFEFSDLENNDSEYNFTTFKQVLDLSKRFPNVTLTMPVQKNWEIHAFDNGIDVGLAYEVQVENGKIWGAYKEKPEGEYAQRVGALIEPLLKPTQYQDPKIDVANAMLEIPGSEIPNIIAYMANRPLSVGEKQIFAEAVTTAKEALIEKQKFQDYKAWIMEMGVVIEPEYFKPSDPNPNTTYKFNPTEENLQEITEDLVIENKKRKAHGQKPNEINVFTPSTTLTAASKNWFYKLPLSKTISNFELNADNDALEFVIEKLRGKDIEFMRVVDNGQPNLFKSFDHLRFVDLMIKGLKNPERLSDLSPKIPGRIIVDYTNSSQVIDQKKIIGLSKQFPKIIFRLDNPNYEMNASINDVDGITTLEFINGEIQSP